MVVMLQVVWLGVRLGASVMNGVMAVVLVWLLGQVCVYGGCGRCRQPVVVVVVVTVVPRAQRQWWKCQALASLKRWCHLVAALTLLATWRLRVLSLSRDCGGRCEGRGEHACWASTRVAGLLDESMVCGGQCAQ